MCAATTRTSLAQLTAVIQRVPMTQRWVYVDEALLRSAASGRPLVRGRRGQRLFVLLAMADAIGCGWLLLWTLALLQFCQFRIRLLLRHRSFARLPGTACPQRLFVGFGAGAEELLFEEFAAENSEACLRLNHTAPTSFSDVMQPAFFEHWGALRRSFASARTAMSTLPTELLPLRQDVLRSIGTRICDYAWFCSWFALFRKQVATSRSQLVFLTPDLAAYAAIGSGLPCEFRQHGLLYHLPLPDFSSVVALTSEEARWFTSRLPDAAVITRATQPRFQPETLHGPTVILSIYGAEQYLSLILPFLHWAQERMLDLLVRPHPRESHDFWQRHGAGSTLQIEVKKESFAAVLDRLHPRLLVSWYSTTLAEALHVGIIPVSICPLDDHNVADMVYPLFSKALQWPRDAVTIEKVLSDDSAYREVLQVLTERGALPSP